MATNKVIEAIKSIFVPGAIISWGDAWNNRLHFFLVDLNDGMHRTRKWKVQPILLQNSITIKEICAGRNEVFIHGISDDGYVGTLGFLYKHMLSAMTLTPSRSDGRDLNWYIQTPGMEERKSIIDVTGIIIKP